MKKNTCFRILFLIISFVISMNTIANERSDCPTENPVFYTENLGLLIPSVKANRAASNYWNVTSIIQNCFDEQNIGEVAWLMTADGETQLSVTLTYTGEDARYKRSFFLFL